MKNRIFILTGLALLLAVPAAHAEIGKTVTMIGEGAVGLPVSLAKLLGGTLKLVGEILLLPFGH